MTNFEIITTYIEENEIDFDYDGSNLQTFAAWKKEGMSVKKGAKAFLKIDLWTMKLENEKDDEGKVVMGEDGKPKKVKKFYRKSSALFTNEQVEKIKKEKKAA
jgi:hypothetical protein